MQQVTTFVIPAASTTPIVVTGFDFFPEVILSTYAGRSELVDTAGAQDINRGFGAAIDVTTQVTTFSYIERGSAASENESGIVSDSLIASQAGGRARLVAIQNGTITVTPTVAFPAAIAVTLLILGENVVTGKALQIETDRSTAGPQNINVGFQPDAAIIFHAHGDPIDTSFSSLGIGVAAGPLGGPIDQFGILGYGRGNGSSTDTRRWNRNGYVYAISSEVPNAEATTERAFISDWTANGMTLEFEQAIADDHQFAVLSLQGPALAVGSIFAGQGRSINLGFVPQGGLFLSTGLIEDPLDPSVMSPDDTMSYGLASLKQVGIDQQSHGMRNEDAKSTNDSFTSIDHDAVITLQDASGAVELAIAMGAPDGNRITFDIQTPGVPAAWPIGFLAFGDIAESVTNERLTTVPGDPAQGATPSEPSTAPIRAFVIDPDEFLDYQLDWSAVFLDENNVSQDTILTSTWISPAEVTIANSPPPRFTTTRTKAWMLVSVPSGNYDVTNRITTATGRIYDRRIRLKVKTR